MQGRLLSTRRAARTPAVTRGSRGSGAAGGSGLADLNGLQRTIGNDAVTRMLLRDGPAQRLPSPSAAAAVPARIEGMQTTFHERMKEAVDIMRGTQDHYNYVNGIYGECYKIHEVVVGQAHEEDVRNEQIQDAIIAAAGLVAGFVAPEGEVITVLDKIRQAASKIEKVRSKLDKVRKIGKLFEKVPGEGGGGATKPSEMQILSLEHVNKLLFEVADVHNEGDDIFDNAVDLSTDIATNTPDSGALGADQAEALETAETACSEVLASAEALLASLRPLRDRRGVPIPSWRETEQDIWIAYFSARHAIGTEQVLCNHMVDIGLWGPPGQPGGRLGVAETEGTIATYRDPKVIPEHDDEEKKQSVGPTTMDWMSIIEAEVAQLPPKWQRIMLLAD